MFNLFNLFKKKETKRSANAVKVTERPKKIPMLAHITDDNFGSTFFMYNSLFDSSSNDSSHSHSSHSHHDNSNNYSSDNYSSSGYDCGGFDSGSCGCD